MLLKNLYLVASVKMSDRTGGMVHVSKVVLTSEVQQYLKKKKYSYKFREFKFFVSVSRKAPLYLDKCGN